MQIIVRNEKNEDVPIIREINIKAFNRHGESYVIDELRNAECETISIVASADGKIVGHIFFSPVTINNKVAAMGLAPVAVLPEYQNQRVGTALINEGIRQVKERGYPFIIVVGESEFYSKYGFIPASEHGLKCQWDVPDESFMVLMFNKVIRFNNEIIKYRNEFAALV